MAGRGELAEASLTRMAEQRGDITAAVLERYYRQMPDARTSFEYHGLGNTAELEGRMVAECVFMLLKWAENPAIARIEQGTTIVHHNDTLEIGPRWYIGLIDALLEELLDSLPSGASDERALWLSLRREIADFIETLRPEFLHQRSAERLPGFPATAR